ncbi:trans-aconitate 2-methyltransferase [Streptomyces sp. A7024]|uniref:Trans-aconitate 2-methyltransferase n=1 Tax=Streptomyces coryli TaxID=1128680 RepID=A0A6G4U7U5_9ACTN|nr:trans-aconitate 2-methyltransferase [Streptomyces coryli]NGN67800.1 trans-aconitate 2-methyltransferase [Streptomyces coryli]
MTTSPSWDPQQYLRHEAHRARPFHDLLARVGDLPHRPARIVDLGCGAGNVTAVLAERWPDAHITGLDNSPEMLESAEKYAGETAGGGRLDFAEADASTWVPAPDEPLDLLTSNALLQWVPGHLESLPAWVEGLAAGGTIAFQLPGNFNAPSHVLMRELADSPRWRARLGGVLRGPDMPDAADYLQVLTGLGCVADTWETTYMQLLQGDDPVLDWVKGTGLRPVLDALADDPEALEAYVSEYAAQLREAYPVGAHGTVFPFRRVFAVGVKER